MSNVVQFPSDAGHTLCVECGHTCYRRAVCMSNLPPCDECGGTCVQWKRVGYAGISWVCDCGNDAFAITNVDGITPSLYCTWCGGDHTHAMSRPNGEDPRG